MRILLCITLLLLLTGRNTDCVLAQSYAVPQEWLDTEGLYYLDTKQNDQDTWAFVIARNGRTIPHKDNDPHAPTKPGFYIGTKHYPFVKYSVTRTKVSFATKTIDGRSFQFQGTVRRTTACNIENIPDLSGRLIETNGSSRTQKTVRFAHAVVC